ncbi:hypothetical protein F511_16385 [Dorcoceras hygrometricum]|uniref:Uncharacterized protein n=1 Tax=Dorcoceras hygrometricum TaxID=472368 RepID=A0A2Z7B4X6_9LAMI|nr:hypothetical protein F511_16385 [Dorcoceras hygrometricum]
MSTGYAKLATGSTVARDWILRLVINTKSIRRIFSARAKRCRINLCKRHRFAIAISKYHLLVNSSLRLDVQATCWYLATAGLKPSADSLARRRFISFTSLLIC